MERVVVAFGGSVVAPDPLDPGFLGRIAERIAAWSRGRHLLVVVGGGAAARRYIAVARELAVAEEDLDRIGVAATRLNAQLVGSLLRAHGVPVHWAVPDTVETAAAQVGDDRPVVVMGGTTPGHSTDYVGAALAHESKATRLIIVTDVKGVYTSDPRSDPDAEHRPELSFDELLQIIGDREWRTAGAAGVIDGPATTLITQQQITTHVVAGDDLENLGAAVAGTDFDGTRIHGASP